MTVSALDPRVLTEDTHGTTCRLAPRSPEPTGDATGAEDQLADVPAARAGRLGAPGTAA